MAEQDIAQQWGSFSPERRQALLGKMNPDQKKALRSRIEGSSSSTPQAPTAAPTEQQPGFTNRLLQGVGLPDSKAALEAAQPSMAEVFGGPAVTAGKLALNYGKNLYEKGKTDLGQVRKALNQEYSGGTNAAGTGPSPTPNIDKAVSAGSDFLLRGVLAPVGGEALGNLYEDSEKHNMPAMLGDAGAVVANLLLLGKGDKPSTGGRENKISYAAGKDSIADIKHSLGEMDKTAKLHGKPETVGDLKENLQQTMNRMNTEAGAAMQPLRGKKTVPTRIADAIRSKITPNMDKTVEGRQMKQRLLNKAKQYDTDWSYEALDHERMQSGARLRALENKSSAQQYTEMLKDPSVAVDKIVNQGVKDYIYPEMDLIVGKPKGYFSDLKSRQSAIIGLSETLEKHISKLEDSSARGKGGPALSGENVSVYAHPGGTPGASVHGLAKALLKPDPMKQANRRVKLGFKGQGKTGVVAKAAIDSLPIRSLALQNDPPANRKEALDRLQPPPQ